MGLLGATSPVGETLIALLQRGGMHVDAFSRNPPSSGTGTVRWHRFADACHSHGHIKEWLSAAPIWVLPEHFDMLKSFGIRRIVALSSTSRFTKNQSSDKAEKVIAARLLEGEERLKTWAAGARIDWVIIRPTLIYGLGRDKNIMEIARFIRRFGFFPLLGKANGLRQPIHVEDVAGVCIEALKSSVACNHAYNISGGETLAYREMVCRVFAGLQRTPRLLPVPLFIFGFAVSCMRLLPKYQHLSPAMAERMNSDLIFDHSEAVRDFRFCPRLFRPAPIDLE
jgi:nucleoside-diphosphate-sugar epimerase